MDAHLTFQALGRRLHLGVCGSVAAFRAAELVRRLGDAGVGVSATLSAGARRFITPLTFQALGASPVYGDLFDGEEPFAHLEPGQIAHAMLIAPASADMLARLAQGRAEDMLSCQALAFAGPLVIAPAMNSRMWNNVATQDNVALLRRRSARFVGPDSGSLACGDEGQGRLADLRAIWLESLRALTPQSLAGRRVLVTLGPTRETWDDVRFWTNASTGVMGASLAVAAWLRGAEVHALCGPVSLWLPTDPLFHRHNTPGARDMLELAQRLWPDMDAAVCSAAVADFRPAPHGPGKFKKQGAEEGFSLRFLPNPDILRSLAAARAPKQRIMGFAAESAPDSAALAEAVRFKLERKGADMIVGNRIADGFARAADRVFVADRYGREEEWPDMPKPHIAPRLLDWLESLPSREGTNL